MRSFVKKALNLSLYAFVCVSCGGSGTDNTDGGVYDASRAQSTIITVGGDFSGNGVLTKVELPSLKVTVNAVAGVVGGDPVLRAIEDRLYIIDRFGGDSITILDRDLQFIGQVSTGAGSNPQDVAVLGDSLYVVLYGESKVIEFSIANVSAGIVSETDLSYLDPDGNANCASIYAVGNALYVACQLLEPNFDAKGPGKVAIIDTETNTVSMVLELNTANPISFFKENSEGDLLISTALNPAAFDPKATGSGCVEKISVNPVPTVEPCVFNNAELGGYISEMDTSGDTSFFINSISFGLASLHSFVDGALQTVPLPEAGENLSGLVSCPTGELVIADNTIGARGLRVYRDGQALHKEILDVAWPTVSYPVNGTICW